MVKIMEKPIKMDDLGVPLFLETPISKKKTGPGDSKWPFYLRQLEVTFRHLKGSRFHHPKKGTLNHQGGVD